MRRFLRALVAALGLAGALWAGARGAGVVPPLGGLLDPWRGAWAAARFAELPGESLGRIANLGGPVEVRYDRRGVPHIFASSVEDAVRALGYVVARDRLFQLDVQTRAASGRLTEWAGAVALDADREMRRIGLPRAAERALAGLPPASVERRVIEAYADGVNGYIDALTPERWPIEYRLLGVPPARWEPINSLHLFNYMGRTLALLDDEKTRFGVAALVGDSAAAALFPVDSPIQEPIQPNGEGAPRFDLPRLPPPGAPKPSAAALSMLLPRHVPAVDEADGDAPRHFASNNWAVAPRRTRDGFALLAGDPHLELTLPSIWYEAHLVVPGVMDAYGVTIPGAPGIIIGFNRDIAWSFTNTGADVLDFYRETVDDSARPARYRLDGSWHILERRLETYRDKRGRVVAEDTLLFSHRGPFFRDADGVWTSMRWTVLEPELNVRAFVDALRATSAREFLDTMARFFGAPAQNMIVADRHGSIAIRSTGRYPLRPDDGSGIRIRDGSASSSDWRGYWPVEKYPQAFDPPQGYLASANQQPLDPRQAFAYLGYEAAHDPWRALQINRLLRADSAVTVDAMRRYQTDPGSVRAERFAPFFVAAARSSSARGGASPRLDSALTLLAAWDHRYTRESTASLLFEAAMRQLPGRIWDELVPNGEGRRRVATPSSTILLALMGDSASLWWDDRTTAGRREDRDEVLAASLEAAYDSLTRRYGARSDGGWAWGSAQAVRVPHVLRLPGFGAPPVAIQGGPGTLNPAAPVGYGPSWRMVVELGPTVRAWGTYPGGQSGNPASTRYLDRLRLWADGALDTLVVPPDTTALPPAATAARLRLMPGTGR